MPRSDPYTGEPYGTNPQEFEQHRRQDANQRYGINDAPTWEATVPGHDRRVARLAGSRWDWEVHCLCGWTRVTSVSRRHAEQIHDDHLAETVS